VTSRRAFLAGVLTVLAAPLASCAARPAPISPPVIRTGLEKDAGASGHFHAALAAGGYSPPETLQEAQQTLFRQGRAGNPNYNITDARGNYVYSVSDHRYRSLCRSCR
jgi:hypothetical protein